MIRWIVLDQTGVMTNKIFHDKQEYHFDDPTLTKEKLGQYDMSETYKEYENGQATLQDVIDTLNETTGLHLDENKFISIFNTYAKPIPGVKEIVDELSKRYDIASASNEGAELARIRLDACEVKQHIRHLILSSEIGLRKPEKEFFEKMLTIIGAKSNEVIYVDDREIHVEGARSVGIQAIQFGGAQQLRKELTSLGAL